MMKRLALTIASMALVTSFSLTACGKQEQPSIEINPSPETIEPTETEEPEPTPEQSSERQVYQQQVTSELQQLNSQIDQLQIQVRQSEALAKEKLNKRIGELIAKMQLRSQLNDELENDMGELLQQLQQQSEPDVQLNNLLQKQTLVQQKIEALLVADEPTWEQTKFEVEEALVTLKQSYEKFQPKPIATESSFTEPESVAPVPTESSSTEPELIEPVPSESSSTEPESVAPVPSESSSTESDIDNSDNQN